MIKRLLALLLFAVPCFAQTQTLVSGTLADPAGIAYYPATVTACLSPSTLNPKVSGQSVNPNQGANYCIGPTSTNSNGTFSMALWGNALISPGGTTWIFTVQAAGTAPPAGNGTLNFSSAGVTISGATQDVSTNINSVGTVQLKSTGGVSPVTSVPGSCTLSSPPVQLTTGDGGIYVPTFVNGTCIYALSAQPGTGLLAATYGVQSNWQIESTGTNFTVTNASPTVTCTTCNFTAADTGKEMFFTTWNGLDSGYPNANGGPLTATTITFVNSTTVTLSQNANLNAGTTNGNAGTLAWGTNDDPASNSPWTAAENAAYNNLNCQNLQVTGITNWEKPHFLTASCRGISGGSTTSKYPGVIGFGGGAGTTILLPPWFNVTNCNGGVSGFACTGLGEWKNIAFNTLGQAGNITKNINFFETFNDGSYSDMSFWGGWNGSALNGVFLTLNGGYHIAQTINSDGSWMPCQVGSNQNPHSLFDTFCGNGKASGNVGAMTLNSGSYLAGFSDAYIVMGNSGIAVYVGTGATYFGYDTAVINPPAVSSACWDAATATSYVYIVGGNCVNNGQTTSAAIIAPVAGGYAYSTGSILEGGATGGAWKCTGKCEEGPGNTYPANPRFFLGTAGAFLPYKIVSGSCTGTATASGTDGLYGTGYNVTTTACATTIGSGIVMDHAGTLYALQVTTSAAGVNASSGAFTVMKGTAGGALAATTITCTVGTGTSCADNTHTVAFVAGDRISIQFTTQGAETLANPIAIVGAY